MEQSKIWLLLARKLSGEASADEKEELNELLMHDRHAQYAAEMMQAFWKMKLDEEKEGENFEALWKCASQNENSEKINDDEKVNFSSVRKGARYKLKRPLATACSLLIVISASIWLLYKVNNKPNSDSLNKSEIITRYGSRSKIILPDGTAVWLNSGSHLTYKNNFKGNRREVTLSGEAYFTVVHDEQHPFIIHTSKMNIEDLGTSFNVKAYPSDKTAEATLIKGSIKITFPDRPKETVTLSPDQKLILFNEDDKLSINNLGNKKIASAPAKAEPTHFEVKKLTINPTDSSVVETSWLNNTLSFQAESFSDIAVQMERWYNVRIIFRNKAVANYHFTGNFKDETVQQALKELQMIRKFRFDINNNDIIIY